MWRTLLEGINRFNPKISDNLSHHSESFKLIAWNHLYYHCKKNINEDLPWIDALFKKAGPTELDIEEASSTHRKLFRILYIIGDRFPFLIRLLPSELLTTAEETKRYFQNKNNIACEIREQLKIVLRPLLKNNSDVLLIGHSMGSIIIYDTLWELSHLESFQNKIDLLTLGSPLGMNYVRRRLKGNQYTGKNKYPTNIRNWTNISAVGDITSLDRVFSIDFAEMQKLEILESIKDYCEGVFNFFRNEEGLNCHRSYGYLINSTVSEVIAKWWQKSKG